jgi:hypothetical protein
MNLNELGGETHKYPLKIPEGLFRALQKLAEEDKRSVGKYIHVTLEQHVINKQLKHNNKRK